MTIQAQLEDGRVLEFPDGTDPNVIQATVKKMVSQQQASPQTTATKAEESTFGQQLVGGLEGALALGTSLIAEPIAGIAGIAAGLDPFRDEGSAAQTVEAVKKALTFDPSTDEGKGAISGLGEALQPAVEKLQKFKQFIGDDAFAATGSPALAAIATTLPEATLELLGAGVGKRSATQAAKRPAKKVAEQAAAEGVKAVEDTTGIRQLTTDVLPPQTRAGKFLQQQGELIEGGQRSAQQAERVASVDKLLTNFNVDDAARFESKIVDSVKNSISAQKKAAGELFDQSTGELSKLGDVALSKTKQFAQKLLDKEVKKGSLADQTLVNQMQDFINAPNDLNFNSVKSIRSAVGRDLGQARAGNPIVGTSDTGVLSQLYSNLSSDMKKFADIASPDLSKKWRQADKEFSEFAVGSNKTGAKNLIKQGDATPEVVDQLLFSKKNSDLDFLSRSLDESGIKSAGQRVLQRVLQKSSIDGSTINPNNFQKQLTLHRNQLGKFFNAADRKAIVEVKNALEQTRRAQDASVSTATGQQVLPLFALTNPTVLLPGVFQAIIERPTLRNLLVKRSAAKGVKNKFAIDQKLQAEINKLGLTGAAITGAATSKLTGEQP